jgi:O-antigen/teichoic acid export membrane protein
MVLEAASVLLLVLPQARQESGSFAAVSVSQFLVRVTLCIALVAGLGWGIWGVLVSSAITSGLYALALAAREVARGARLPDAAGIRAMLRFALPFVPGGLGFFLLNSGDRFFLLRCGGEQEVGTYALGYKLALGVSIVSRTPLCMVWSARMYEAARTPDAPALFGRVFSRILGAYLLAGLALCLFQDEVVLFLGGARYAAAAAVIPPVVLAYAFLTGADLMDAGFYVRRRTGRKTPIALASTAWMCLLYALLIPPYGAVGAALATLGGFVGHAALTRLVSQRVFPVRYEAGRLAAMLALAGLVWLAGRALPAAVWAVPAKVLLWGTWPTLLWVMGVVSAEEKAWARAAARQLAAGARAVFTLRRVGEVP